MDLLSPLDNFDLQLASFVLDFVCLNKSKRKGAWRFNAMLTCPGHIVVATATDSIVLQNELRQIENEMKRLELQTEKFPLYLRNKELKYKHSEWELARTNIPIQLPVQDSQEYIQSQNYYSIDPDNLN